MDSAVYSPTACQPRIRRVSDRINGKFGDVTLNQADDLPPFQTYFHVSNSSSLSQGTPR